MSKGKNGFRLILAPRTKISRKFYYHFFEAFQYDKKGVLIVDVKLRVETEVFIQGGWVGVAVRFLGLRLVVPVCPVKNFFEARIIGGRKVLLRNWHYCAKCKKNSGVAVARSEEHTSELQLHVNIVCR